MKSENGFCCPSQLKTHHNQPRHVGYELEFAGLNLVQVCDVLCQVLNGTAHHDTQAESRVLTKQFGEFFVELDWKWGKEIARDVAKQQADGDANLQSDSMLVDMLTRLARQVVPIEVVCPPLEIAQLPVLDDMVQGLHARGAVGTEDSLVYAFGVHINVELPDLSANTVARYLKAYCLAQKWLYQVNKVDFSRRLTPYIDAYPEDYIDRVLNYDNHVDMDTLMDDYLNFNSTRNRGLDMLPLFKHINTSRILAALDDDRIKARPTFHYRLPNCEIGKQGWRLRESWNIWCVIEHLAYDDEALQSMTGQRAVFQSNLLNLNREPWHADLNRIHQSLLSE